MRAQGSDFPVRNRLAALYWATAIAGLLCLVASIWGLVDPEMLYTREEFVRSFMPNDVVNLAVGMPILIGSIWAAKRKRLLGLLFWPGALLYVIYNYLAYLLAIPFSWGYLLHLLIVVVSLFALVGLIIGIDADQVRQRLKGKVPERLGGGVLIGLGVLFFIRVLALFLGALLSGAAITETETAVSAVDVFLAPASVIGGLLLWRKHELGYVFGLGLLFQESMLFIGLIAFLLLQPVLTDAPLAMTDIVFVIGMGLVCFVPFGMFVRGSGDAAGS